ncbi:class II aldolase/adducin family protein [Methylobacterium gossipiicola]|uniref:L-fuculose-phosphate aldolase n=1 Tax=Methylobacterium gossipiicola TaxID=582675 RepID=A0A1I2T3I5_9HYPH|nr:class II aldolase/adducin family protein [Methylobacterium gossipiicola]SFG59533.1 L-fuculose-phosphate aldolase [Methylobacterium gossipiicola]
MQHNPRSPAADALRASEAVVAAMRDLIGLGLSQGTSGNVSVRHGDGFLVSPTGIPADILTPDDIVPMTFAGTWDHRLAPSSEWRFHRDILARRPEIGAVVHAHPTYCTAFALCGRDIPAVHYMIAAVGGPTIRCAPYAPYGTDALSDLALAALEGRAGCLLANHGMIATGPTLEKALWLAVEMETLCRQYAIALQVGTPVILPDDEIARTVERFKTYGPRARTDAQS